jgi:hypothetical protein
MVRGGARPARRTWRRAKSRRKLQRAVKRLEQKTATRESPHDEQPDRLLLSALTYWEVRRDLIEERVAAIRSAPAVS